MIGTVAKDLGREVKIYISPAAIQSAEPMGSSHRPEGGTAHPFNGIQSMRFGCDFRFEPCILLVQY